MFKPHTLPFQPCIPEEESHSTTAWALTHSAGRIIHASQTEIKRKRVRLVCLYRKASREIAP